MENILVAGGAGYIGSHVVSLLCRSGYQVDVLDNLSTGHHWAIHPNATFHRVDLLDVPAVEVVFSNNRFDAVIHFASKSLVGESMRYPYLYFQDNISSALNLLEIMEKFDVRRFVFSSSANIFGATKDELIDERAPICPGSPYGESKLAIERFLKWGQQIFGLNYVSLRYFNAAGADPNGRIGEVHEPETHLIPIVLQVAMGLRDKVTVFGDDYQTKDGTCIRDYVHVCDLATAHQLALERTKIGCLSCNLGTGTGYSVFDIIRSAEQVSGKSVSFDVGHRRPGDPAWLVADPSLAKSELGWGMKHSDLNTILKTAWNWHSGQ